MRGHLDLGRPCRARQPEIAPDIVLKMKFDWPPVIGNAPAVPFQTMPVGPPATWTTVLLIAPVAGMIVDVLVPLLAGHHGDVGLLTSPQGFLMFGSTRSAGTAAELDTQIADHVLIARRGGRA